jgi:hypothetical protein
MDKREKCEIVYRALHTLYVIIGGQEEFFTV